MSRSEISQGVLVRLREEEPPDLKDIVNLIGIDISRPERLAATLPFCGTDATGGAETELQAAVLGQRRTVDLPVTIEQSNYYANLVRRAAAGDLSRKNLAQLENFLNTGSDRIWENSWVRFPRSCLSPFADSVFCKDLLADKRKRNAGMRGDVHRFLVKYEGEETVRVPVSYLLKIALADIISMDERTPRLIQRTGADLMAYFLSDNTSPETHSMYIVNNGSAGSPGKPLARETSLRFLLTQLLLMYANEKFLLRQNSQAATAFYSPNPPVRQKELNQCISDSFYRDLFMNPCLSGWDRGELKHDYMRLCHEVLSRSQMNAVAKLREAGILTSNLVVLPNISNISLANNGTHVSIGSRRLTGLLSAPGSGFTHRHEKYAGDLVIKIVEHFLPLFVCTYSAAPFRLDFHEFHPEKVLGFLPHEMDYTHLRMFWRRWKKKADIGIMGNPVTPFGPEWIDRLISTLFRLRGDFLPDLRLIDYPGALMSTGSSPALDGTPGNGERLKRDLAELGVFDSRMSLYLLYKLRGFDTAGFSGFEGRHYSLFENHSGDMRHAVCLQNLLNALAFKYIASGQIGHADIPDDPILESERRQIIFGAAAGIPTFFVRADSRNRFLKSILGETKRTRSSRRYPGYHRVHNIEYRRALLHILKREAKDLIEIMGMEETVRDLENRIEIPEFSVAGKITAAILGHAGARTPMDLDAASFNTAAEAYYRGELRRRHTEEGLDFLEKTLFEIPPALEGNDSFRQALRYVLKGGNSSGIIQAVRRHLEKGVSLDDIRRAVFLVILSVFMQQNCAGSGKGRLWDERASPVL
jgi:hypothetical protein